MQNFPAVIGQGSFGTILRLRLELRNLKPRRLVTSYRKAFRLWRPAIPPGHHAFICNICGVHASAELARILERDAPSCPRCNSTLRFRAMMAALEEELLGTGKPLVRCRKRKDLDGVGLTDSGVYSHLLEEKFSYINTFFHARPYLDLMAPPAGFQSRFDFIICADVMEHIPPPIQVAFANLRTLLRPGGLLLFSVPYSRDDKTVEYFPDLHQFEILGDGAERYLVNVTRAGESQVFKNLEFHGGTGATLEMRLFCEADILRLLHESGFRQIKIHSQSLPKWGIIYDSLFSLPITALAG